MPGSKPKEAAKLGRRGRDALLLRLFTAGAAILSRDIAQHLLDVQAAARVGWLLALLAFDSSTHGAAPFPG